MSSTALAVVPELLNTFTVRLAAIFTVSPLAMTSPLPGQLTVEVTKVLASPGTTENQPREVVSVAVRLNATAVAPEGTTSRCTTCR